MNSGRLQNYYLRTLCLIFNIVTFILLAQTVAQAQVSFPWYEPFSYATGEVLGGTNVSGASWTLGDGIGTGSTAMYPICNLTYSGLATSTNSGGAIIPAITTGKNRRVGVLLPTVSSGPLYTSFLLNVQTLPSGDNMFAALSSVTTSTPGSSANGIWVNSSGQLLVSVNSTTASSPGGTTALATNSTHFVVACYNTTSKSLALWLDPSTNSFGASEGSLPAPNLNVTNSSGKTTMSSFYINHAYTYPQCALMIDEIRAATTWAAVTPTAAAPAPAAANRLSFTAQPGYAGTGSSVGAVTVQVLDQYGKPFAANNVPVTVSLIGNGSLGGTTLTQNTDSSGKVTFTGLTVSSTGVKQLSATGTSLAAGTSDYFSIVSGTGGSGSVPAITSATKSGSNLLLHGVNGQASQSYSVIGSANLTTPRSSWSVIGSSSFQANGNFDFTNTIGAGIQFISLKYTPSGGGPVSLPSFAKMGWINSNNITGGAGGQTITVSNYSDFTAYIHYPLPLTIRVVGTITDPNAGAVPNDYAVIDADNKTIIGVGTNAHLEAVDLRFNATNIICRNLYFDVLPGGTNDSITMDGGSSGTNKYAWVDHCSFMNAQDGSLDITKGADYVTVSWCRFAYSITDNPKRDHRLVTLMGSSDTDSGTSFHATFHHNWYNTNCLERMPSVRFGRVHIFNNYYGCAGNDYCVRSRLYAQVLVENNYFDHVNDALEKYINTATGTEPSNAHGLLNQTNNLFVGCTTNYNYILLNDADHTNPGSLVSSNSTSITFTQNGTYQIVNVDPFNDTLPEMNLTPNSGGSVYWYTLDQPSDVPNIVTGYSGPGVLLPLP